MSSFDDYHGLPAQQPMRCFEDVGPTFTATFDSTCGNCRQTLEVGQEGQYDGGDAVHVKCPTKRAACPHCWLVHGTHQEECE